MIKVLGFAMYGPLAASTRYRLGQYIPGLAANGIELSVCHLLSDEYLRQRFQGGRFPLCSVLSGAIARLRDLSRLRDHDLAVVYGELLPLIPALFELAFLQKPYIYDFDDAFYLKYRTGRLRGFHPLMGNKFDDVIRGAHAITAGSRVLRDYAIGLNKKTSILPTVVDTTRYLPNLRTRGGTIFTIGWIGSPSTAPYLSELVGPLSALGREGPVRFVVIGAKAPVIANVDVVEIPWREDREVELLNQFDVGVMPLPNDDWARGKCAFKLIQYMACGLPVIASPVGANIDVVSQECGFLAGSADQWLQSLQLLRDNRILRLEMGQFGRTRVINHYSLAGNLSFLAETIRQVAQQ